MQKKFVSNLILIVLLNLLVKPLAIFGIDAEVQNEVGAEQFGIYFSLLNFSFLFNILLDFGINNFTTKNVAQHPKIASKYFGKILTARLVLFVIYVVVSLSIGLVLKWNGYELYLLLLLLTNQFFIALIAYARSHFGGLMLFKTEAVISVLDKILLIIICGYYLYFPQSNHPKFEIETFIWIQLVCYFITLVVSFIVLFSKIGKPVIRHNKAFTYSIIRKSFPYALLILLMMIYTRIDSVMVERIHVNGKAEAGYYAQGFRLLNALFMFAMIFSNLLFPIFSKMFKQKENVIPMLAMSSKLLIGGALLIALISFFNSEFILSIIYKNDIFISAQSFKYIMLSFVGMCATLIFGTLLTARGDLKFLNITSAIGILINIIINLILIPKYGAVGASIATVVTQTLVSIVQINHCFKTLSVRLSMKQSFLFTSYVILLIVVLYYFPIDSVSMLLLSILSGLILMFVFQLIQLKVLKQLFLPIKKIK